MKRDVNKVGSPPITGRLLEEWLDGVHPEGAEFLGTKYHDGEWGALLGFASPIPL